MTISELINVLEFQGGTIFHIHNEDMTENFKKKALGCVYDGNFQYLIRNKEVKLFRVINDNKYGTLEFVTD